jgi:ATP-dependent RNA circularization protein (DNA/RNA ligase family)
MKVKRYKLRLVRVEYRDDAHFAGLKHAVSVEEGPFLQHGNQDVVIAGYAKAINRAGELNEAIKKEGNWDKGWRFHTKEVTMEEQQNLFDVSSGD